MCVRTDDEGHCSQLTYKRILHELLGRPPSDLLVEVDQVRRVETAGGYQVQAVVQVSEKEGSTLGTQNLSRMSSERDHGRRDSSSASLHDCPTENSLMAQVHTIKCAEGGNDSGSIGMPFPEMANLHGITLRGLARNGNLRTQDPATDGGSGNGRVAKWPLTGSLQHWRAGPDTSGAG